MSTTILSNVITTETYTTYLQEAAWKTAWEETVGSIMNTLLENGTDPISVSFFHKQLVELDTHLSWDTADQDHPVLQQISATTQAHDHLKDTTVKQLKEAFHIIALSEKLTDQQAQQTMQLLACLCCYKQKLDYPQWWFDDIVKIWTAYASLPGVYGALRSYMTDQLDWYPTYSITSNPIVQHNIHKNTNEIAISFRDLQQFPQLRTQLTTWKDMSQADQYITFVSPRFLELMTENWCSYTIYQPSYQHISTWETKTSLPPWEKIWTTPSTRKIQRSPQT